MGIDFKNALGAVLSEFTIRKVIEFGAGNLKNIPFILFRDKLVHAVDFEEVLNLDQTNNNLTKCTKYGQKFRPIIFPNEFIDFNETYDLGILSHVLAIMPVFAERLLALQYLYQKIRDNKYLLWYSQVESREYKKRRISGSYDCGDGIWLGKNQAFRTFFKHYEPIEIDEIMILSGFLFIKKYSCDMGHIRLYQKQNYNIFENIVNLSRLNEVFNEDTSNFRPIQGKDIIVDLNDEIKSVSPNPDEFSLTNLYLEKLASIRSGIGQRATQFHRLSAIILWFSLYTQIGDIRIERIIDEGLGKIDVTFQNKNKEGFFKDLKDLVDIRSPLISVECKNYTNDISNPEIDQLSRRLNRQRGMLGFLTCRAVEDKERLRLNLKLLAANEQKYIIVLEDRDLEFMVSERFKTGEEGINAFLRGKYEELIA
ncbi:MAG: hypothetical protein ACXADY_20670 [Candidatus Hodarchaeales archaeon]